jgi:hypothetical protein
MAGNWPAPDAAPSIPHGPQCTVVTNYLVSAAKQGYYSGTKGWVGSFAGQFHL